MNEDILHKMKQMKLYDMALAFNTSLHNQTESILTVDEMITHDKHENILITGSTGIGKSYLASALGNQACMLGYKVYSMNTAQLPVRQWHDMIGENTIADAILD